MKHLSFRVLLVAVLVPFALAVAGVAAQLAWLQQLPADVITHWGVDGPDRVAPAWTVPFTLGLIGVLVPGVFGIVLARAARRGGPTVTQKLLAAVSLFVLTEVSILTTASLYVQLPPKTTTDIAPFVLVGLVIALIVAVIGWFVMPRAVSGRSISDAAPPVALRPGEKVAWVGRARFSTSVFTILVVVLVLLTGLVVFLSVSLGTWWLLLLPLVIGVSLPGTGSWLVRVDDRGLTVRSALGWPQFVIPPAEVASATVSTVTGLGEFGGWGLRYATSGRVGVITRSGEALEVQRRNGRTLVVTVDDAGTAAGLLTALAARVG